MCRHNWARNLVTPLVCARRHRQMTIKCTYSGVELMCSVLRTKWSWFYSGMIEFNCLVVVLFRAMFSCFLLDSFELQEMVCLTKHGATFS